MKSGKQEENFDNLIIFSSNNSNIVEIGRNVQLFITTQENPTETLNVNTTYLSSDSTVMSVTSTGQVTAHKTGVVVLSASAFLGGNHLAGKCTMISGTPKQRRTLFKDEHIENAKKNIKKYDWAKKEYDQTIKLADIYVDNTELLWEMVTSQELPRASALSSREDTNTRRFCPRCGRDIMTLYGNQPWVIHPLKDPWKIQCPGCHSRFPSNDFSKFYQAGIGEDGFFHYELAKKRGQQYLKNELYPDLDENAYVDDGYGYLTGVTLPDGTRKINPFIAYYNYFGLWGSSGGNGILVDALIALGNAYLFTGESKYGYTGAILLDRMADVYIDMDLTPYAYLPGSDGHAKRGKVLGRIADYRLACTLAQSYDQLWPAYDDPKVIEFLSTKAGQFHMKNPKTDGNAIRMNVDNHILREIYKAVLDGRVNGNWGYYHLSLATAAVVLDHMPETGIWIDWLFQTGTSSVYEVTGGNINAQLLEVIDRDGLGNEASFSYNNTWISTLLEIAKIFRDYDGYEKENLYHHPKIKRMFLSASDYINIGRTVPNIGDTTTALSFYIMPSAKSALIEAWRAGIWDVNIAHTLYNVNGRTVDGLRADIFTKHPEKIRDDILTMLSNKPDHKILSKNFSGFGLMMLQAGIYKESDNTDSATDTQRGFWIYYGRNTGHGHKDKLNLGGYAHGLDMLPDLGNPTSKTINAKRLQWDVQPLAHNTVVVNEGIKDPDHITNNKSQNPSAISTPLHFDDAGQVKVMDVQAPEVYDAAEIFRRTVVSIDVDDDSSYAVDFFRVKGGHDHIYSFHAQSNDVTIEDVPFISQIGGTYAGVDVQSGPDPLTVTGDWSSPLHYPPGYTWLYDVKRAKNPTSATITADFKITDFRRTLSRKLDLHLCLTMLNSDASQLSEATIASFQPAKSVGAPNELKKVLLRRQGKDLDTLFTSVIEPYIETRNITFIQEADVRCIEGMMLPSDSVRGVKVTLANGRVDYIIYSTNKSVLFEVDHSFMFRGTIGVYSVKNNEVVLSYVNDGDIIGGHQGCRSSVTGQVIDFTHDLTDQSTIMIHTDQNIDPDLLAGRYIYVDNNISDKGEYNSCYEIQSGECINENILLHLGNSSLIRGYVDQKDFGKGYLYYVAEGMKFHIPLSFIAK